MKNTFVKEYSSAPLHRECIEGILDAKGLNVVTLDLSEIDNAVCDHFIICEGTSNTHVSSIADTIEKRVREEIEERPWHVEGKEQSEWVLMDYVGVVVHIFQRETRTFYDLESLWSDAKIERIENGN
ncbi:MAG: ribosome silencing factor [Cryomorphaceae bacterium]|nr:ribosome silencing factor [Cryomorphaceae bacterium]